MPRDVPLVVTEGNYLLRTGRSRPVRDLLDATWSSTSTPRLRPHRLVARHVLHGRTPDAAERWVASSDDPNARLVEAIAAYRADLVVRLAP